MRGKFHICPAGDHAVTIVCGDTISEEIHDEVMRCYQSLTASAIAGVKDIIPAYNSVTVIYDIALVKKQTTLAAVVYIQAAVEAVLHKQQTSKPQTRNITIPVCYDKLFGTDLCVIADQKNLSTEEIISIHCMADYKVYMLGFLPGFAYMGITDARIAVPRLSVPRAQVAAGSVGIAERQTGIYPLNSPGGWSIIGRTPLTLFDARREKPCLLQYGDIVRFKQISADEFAYLKNSNEHPHS